MKPLGKKSLHELRRRGLILVLVLAVIVMAGALLTAMATWSAQGYRMRQADQVRLAAHAIADSAAGYARAHLADWSTHPPESPITLDVSPLLPPRATGSAAITFHTADDRRFCRVSGTAQLGPCEALDEIELTLPAAAGTQPAVPR